MHVIKGIILGSLLASTASAKPMLRNVEEIDDNMLKVAIAIEISERCDSINARRLKGLNYLWGLKNRASELGYSDKEIRAYVESNDEKARMREEGEAFMRAKGLNPESNSDLCKLGLDEIEKGSLIGGLLRAK